MAVLSILGILVVSPEKQKESSFLSVFVCSRDEQVPKRLWTITPEHQVASKRLQQTPVQQVAEIHVDIQPAYLSALIQQSFLPLVHGAAIKGHGW